MGVHRDGVHRDGAHRGGAAQGWGCTGMGVHRDGGAQGWGHTEMGHRVGAHRDGGAQGWLRKGGPSVTYLGASQGLAELTPGSHRPQTMARPWGQLAVPGCGARGVGEEAALRAGGSGQQGQCCWRGRWRGRPGPGHWEQRAVSPSVEIPEMVLSAPRGADGMREKMGESPWPAMPCHHSCPNLLVPQFPPAPRPPEPTEGWAPAMRSGFLPFSAGTVAKRGQADGSPGQ